MAHPSRTPTLMDRLFIPASTAVFLALMLAVGLAVQLRGW